MVILVWIIKQGLYSDIYWSNILWVQLNKQFV